MNVKRIVAGLMSVSLLALGSTFVDSARAADASPNVDKTKPNVTAEKPTADQKSSELKNVSMALDLVQYARTNKSVPAMLAAAEIIGNTSTSEDPVHFGAKTTDAKGSETKNEGTKTSQSPGLDAKALLMEAKPWAQGNEQLTALVDKAVANAGQPKTKMRGASVGPQVHRDHVNANSVDTYTIQFRGGERAEVAVVGDGDNDLDLYVYDSNGNLIGSDTDSTDQCLVQFVPYWTSNFSVRVVNRGRLLYSNYLLMTN